MDTSERFRDLAHAAAAPNGLRASVPSAIELGQVWRLRGGDTSLAVMMASAPELDADLWRISVIPIILEPWGEDERTLVAESMHGPFGVPAALWCGLKAAVPVALLDVAFGSMSVQVADCCVAISEDRTVTPPDHARFGRATTSVFAAAAEVEAELIDDLESLQACSGTRVALAPTSATLKQLGTVDLAEAIAALGVTQPVAMQILRGHGSLSGEQREVLARLAGLDRGVIDATFDGVSAEAAKVVDQPRVRPSLEQIASRKASNLRAMRERAARFIAQGALAARQTGSSPSLEDRLARWIEMELDEDPRA